MPNLNKVMLMGNLTRDPEIKYTPKGLAIADISLAINRYSTNEATGEKKEETTYVDVTLWGRQAEIAKEYLFKGKPAYIEGRLTLDTWDDKATGQKRSKLKVTGEALQLIGAKGDGPDGGGSGGGGNGGNRYSSAPRGGGDSGGGGDDYDQRPSRPQQQQQPAGGAGARPKPRPAPPTPDPDDEDDIPF